MVRLGDAVATFAQPIARGIDSVFGTDLEGCVTCKQRRAWLNEVTDELFEWTSRRARDNDTSPMDFVVTKTITAQYVITDAKDPDDAIERAQKGEGVRSQGAQSWNASLRPGGVTGPK